MSAERQFVSRAGTKLAFALEAFRLSPSGRICADLGSNAGGFVDCLLQHGATKVYAVERGYGVIDFRLRGDQRVVVMERTDALHVHLPDPADLVTIDVGWTRQCRILPAARRLLAKEGEIVTLVKPHYEADIGLLDGGVLPIEHLESVLEGVRTTIDSMGLALIGETRSPIEGRGGNTEVLWHLRPT